MKFIPKPIVGSLREVVESVFGNEVRHSIYMYMGEVQINGSSMEHWVLQHTCRCRGNIPGCVREGKTALDVMKEEAAKQELKSEPFILGQPGPLGTVAPETKLDFCQKSEKEDIPG